MNKKTIIDQQFRKFHRQNPDVYHLLIRLCRRLKRAGYRSFGMKALFEQVRWHFRIETNDPDFILNNNYTSRYARLIMRRNKNLRGFFELRALA